MAEPIISIKELRKDYRQGFFMRWVTAVRNVSFEVERGDIFGFIGPNGAGKTTTLKVLMGLAAPTSGSASMFGVRVPNPRALTKIGFLPENPYIYPYLTPTEFVEMCGSLSGLRGRALRHRARDVLAKVGISYAADRPARKLSKGMLQRLGLAAALVADPELLVLDEPMSGLDPVGRKEVRDLIIEERRAHRTILFSTHILSDVETLCDRVTILRKGEVVVSGKLDQLLHRDSTSSEIYLEELSDDELSRLRDMSIDAQRNGARVVVRVASDDRLQETLAKLVAQNYRILEVAPRQETLEDLFVREAIG